jgi:hypothetical protein
VIYYDEFDELTTHQSFHWMQAVCFTGSFGGEFIDFSREPGPHADSAFLFQANQGWLNNWT